MNIRLNIPKGIQKYIHLLLLLLLNLNYGGIKCLNMYYNKCTKGRLPKVSNFYDLVTTYKLVVLKLKEMRSHTIV